MFTLCSAEFCRYYLERTWVCSLSGVQARLRAGVFQDCCWNFSCSIYVWVDGAAAWSKRVCHGDRESKQLSLAEGPGHFPGVLRAEPTLSRFRRQNTENVQRQFVLQCDLRASCYSVSVERPRLQGKKVTELRKQRENIQPKSHI